MPGLGVKFSHNDEQDSGYVKILSPEGEVIVESEDFQHNRNYHKRTDTARAFAEAIVEAMPTFAKQD
jgi:hypothetical protein